MGSRPGSGPRAPFRDPGPSPVSGGCGCLRQGPGHRLRPQVLLGLPGQVLGRMPEEGGWWGPMGHPGRSWRKHPGKAGLTDPQSQTSTLRLLISASPPSPHRPARHPLEALPETCAQIRKATSTGTWGRGPAPDSVGVRVKTQGVQAQSPPSSIQETERWGPWGPDLGPGGGGRCSRELGWGEARPGRCCRQEAGCAV